MIILRWWFLGIGIFVLSVNAFLLLDEDIKQNIADGLRMEANALINELLTEPDSFLLSGFNSINGFKEPPNFSFEHVSVDERIEKWVVKSDTEALLIFKEGRVLYETYSPESDKGRSINGMSMVKNIIAILIGIAIDEERILSKHDDVRLYLPELTLEDGETLSIRDLLNHKSGIKENPFSIYSTLKGQTLEEGLTAFIFASDREFTYKNTNYHILSLVLTRIYQKPLSKIIEEKLWQPLRLSEGRIIDSAGYCCLFATARSWLALGQLYLDEGRYKGTQIVSNEWIDNMLTDKEHPDRFFVQATGRTVGNSYGYHIYHGLPGYPDYFWIEGMGLQVLLINPEAKIIIVRLGGIPAWYRSNSNRSDQHLLADLLKVVAEG